MKSTIFLWIFFLLLSGCASVTKNAEITRAPSSRGNLKCISSWAGNGSFCDEWSNGAKCISSWAGVDSFCDEWNNGAKCISSWAGGDSFCDVWSGNPPMP